MALSSINNYGIDKVIIVEPFANLMHFDRTDSDVTDCLAKVEQIMNTILPMFPNYIYLKLEGLNCDENGDPAPTSNMSRNHTIPGPSHEDPGFAVFAREMARAVKCGAYEITRIINPED